MDTLFRKEWPPGCEPTQEVYKYFTRQFVSIKGYNWLLLPCVKSDGNPKHWGSFHDGSITMKFFYSRPYTANHHPNTFERRGVLIHYDKTLLHLYLDEDAKLFATKTSEVAVGQLNIVKDLWDGTANVDIGHIRTENPLSIWTRNPWN